MRKNGILNNSIRMTYEYFIFPVKKPSWER